MPAPTATLLFPKKTWREPSTNALVVDGLEVRELRSSWKKSSLDRTTDLVKRSSVAKLPEELTGLSCEDDEWIVGTKAALYRSVDRGETWRREELPTSERVTQIARFAGTAWWATDAGTLAYCKETMAVVALPHSPLFERVSYDSSHPYPRVAIARLRVIDGTLYVLGHGLWAIDASRTATLVVPSPAALLIDLAKTDAGTLIVVGVRGTIFRKEAGATVWHRVEGNRDHTFVGVVPMMDGVLLVATRSLHWSTDDGQTSESLGPIDVGEGDGRSESRHHVAIPDGHGGALVAAHHGALLRVSHDGLGPWKSAKPTKAQARSASAPTPERPREKDPTVEKRLLADVIAAPDDDAPRLVYADWLTEHGDPRGEFIQLQCLLKHGRFGASFRRIDAAEPHPDHVKLELREEALLKKHAKEWLAPVRKHFHAWTWRRGFLHDIVSNAAFFEGADEILRRHPVRYLELGGLKKRDHATFAKTNLGTIRKLNLSEQRIGLEEADMLLGKNLADIESLLLWANPLTDDGVVKLVTKSHLSKLRELSLLMCNLTDDAVRAIASSPLMKNLELLTIRMRTMTFHPSNITRESLLALAASTTLTKLQHVSHDVDRAANADAIRALRARLAPGWNQRRWEPYSSPVREAV